MLLPRLWGPTPSRLHLHILTENWDNTQAGAGADPGPGIEGGQKGQCGGMEGRPVSAAPIAAHQMTTVGRGEETQLLPQIWGEVGPHRSSTSQSPPAGNQSEPTPQYITSLFPQSLLTTEPCPELGLGRPCLYCLQEANELTAPCCPGKRSPS